MFSPLIPLLRIWPPWKYILRNDCSYLRIALLWWVYCFSTELTVRAVENVSVFAWFMPSSLCNCVRFEKTLSTKRAPSSASATLDRRETFPFLKHCVAMVQVASRGHHTLYISSRESLKRDWRCFQRMTSDGGEYEECLFYSSIACFTSPSLGATSWLDTRKSITNYTSWRQSLRIMGVEQVVRSRQDCRD